LGSPLTPPCVGGGGRKWKVIAEIQILSQTFIHDKIKAGLPIILELVMMKNCWISLPSDLVSDSHCIFPIRAKMLSMINVF
jgi:hypothetical protein